MIAPHEEKGFVSWMRENNLLFNGDEYHLRLGIWLSNARFVREHNAANSKFQLELNKFAHLTPAEYNSMLGAIQSVVEHRQRLNVQPRSSESFSWVDKKAVNPKIKNQDQCGSCWAFAAIQAVESQYKMIGKFVSLSEQNLIDCCENCNGCGGGTINAAYKHVIDNQEGCFIPESDYKYEKMQMHCKYDQLASKKTSKIVDFTALDSDEEYVKRVVEQYGPCTTALNAGLGSFKFYKKGVYDVEYCPTDTNHEVGIVGFGVLNGVDYWLCRNSWGENWGDAGYFKIARNKDFLCQIAKTCYIPFIEK